MGIHEFYFYLNKFSVEYKKLKLVRFATIQGGVFNLAEHFMTEFSIDAFYEIIRIL